MKLFERHKAIDGLVGATLESVCVGKYIIHLKFDTNATIAEELKASYESGGNVSTYDIQTQSGSFEAYKAVGGIVSSIDVLPNTLRLTFDNDAIISLFTEEGAYECCNIYYEGGFLSF